MNIGMVIQHCSTPKDSEEEKSDTECYSVIVCAECLEKMSPFEILFLEHFIPFTGNEAHKRIES